METGGAGAWVASRLSPPESLVRGYDRMVAVAQVLQLAVGAVALAALWLLQPYPRDQQIKVTALLLGMYLPWSLLSRRTATAGQGPLSRILHLSIDLAALGCFAIVIPPTGTSVMLAYSLVVAFHAYVSGRVAGLAVTGGSFILVGIAEWHAPLADRHDLFTLVMYAAVTVALAVMVDALATERRRITRHLGRLQQALDAVAAEPTLTATADSISRATKDAVHAIAVLLVMPLHESGAGLRVAGSADLPDELQDMIRTSLLDPEHSPSRQAMATGQVVSVPDMAHSVPFSWMADVLGRHGVRSMVSVPLGPASGPVGVLNAYLGEVGALDDDDLELLHAYSRQASLAIARATAFEQERRASARLAEADGLKTDFVSTISHELRTPLTSITGFVDTVLLQWDRLTDADKRDLLERVSWNAAELRRLIEQVLTFSAIEQSADDDEREPFALGPGVADLVHHMAPALRGCPVRLRIEPGLVVLASRPTVHQVLGNLLTNAAKFSPAGSEIRIDGRRRGGMAEVTVIDQGPGVPETDRDKIFDRFFRGSTTASTRGTGIGLSIVRAGVQRLGGTVDLLENGPDNGTGARFRVRIPLADESAEADVVLL